MNSSTQQSSRPDAPPEANVLFLFRGPVNDLDHDIGNRLRLLSSHLAGLAVALAYEERITEAGRFRIWSPKWIKDSSTLHKIHLTRRIISFVRQWQQETGKRIELVVASDPLRIGLTAWMIARAIGARLVVEVNGDYGHPANYVHMRSAFRRWLKRSLFVGTEKFILARAQGIRLLYDRQLDELDLRLSGKVVARYPEYVDLAPFANLGEKKTVLLVGFPFWVKGVDILIKAFRQIADRYPGWQLEILGFYPDSRELDAAMGGDPRIHHLVPVPHAEMPEVIGRCGIYVSASRTEAMGRVLLEAMACGKPRIASDVGGCHTVVEDQVDGFLFPSGDADRLAALMSRLMDDEALRRQLGGTGQERARAEFSTRAYRDNVLAFFRRVLESA